MSSSAEHSLLDKFLSYARMAEVYKFKRGSFDVTTQCHVNEFVLVVGAPVVAGANGAWEEPQL